MTSSIFTHTRRILKTIPAQIIFGILLVFMLVNYTLNLIENTKVQYVTQMVDPIKTITTSSDSRVSMFLMLLYPLLVVFPTCTQWLSDRGTGIVNQFESRSGRKCYWIGKLIAVFLSTFIIFALPFLLELLLCLIAYDPSSRGDMYRTYLDSLETDHYFFLYSLWARSRYLYALVMVILWGGASGILACFNYSLTILPFMRFRIFTFFPVYLLLHGALLLGGAFQSSTIFKYNDLFCMFYYHVYLIRNDLLYFLLMLGLLMMAVVIVLYKAGKDQLS